jgi:hypothetical protein
MRTSLGGDQRRSCSIKMKLGGIAADVTKLTLTAATATSN